MQPAGVITGYDLRFGEKVIHFDADADFHITSGDYRAQNVLVEVCKLSHKTPLVLMYHNLQIRANNTVASSEWSTPQPIGMHSKSLALTLKLLADVILAWSQFTCFCCRV